MNIQNVIEYIDKYHKAFTVIISTFIGLIALLTLIKAIMEFRLQGSQKRAELYNKFDNVFDEESIKQIVYLLETNVDNKNVDAISSLPLIDRYYFLGFYEQIYLAVNSKLLSREIAYYMFGKFAVNCWKTPAFWIDIDRESYDWLLFRNFIIDMNKVEKQAEGRKNKGSFGKSRADRKFRH